MNTQALLKTILAVSVAVAPLAGAQTDHGAHASPPATKGNASGAHDLSKLTGKAFDRAMLSMMIAHHKGAVDMSKAVQARLKDPQVKRWAQAVIADQTKEINLMSAWLKGMGGADVAMQGAMAADMQRMVTPLKSARNPDRAFVQGMIPHHASALDMANLALQKSADLRVLKLARDIIKAQADEMYAFKQWLATN